MKIGIIGAGHIGSVIARLGIKIARVFATIEGCSENQGFWDAILTIETAIHMTAPNELPKAGIFIPN